MRIPVKLFVALSVGMGALGAACSSSSTSSFDAGALPDGTTARSTPDAGNPMETSTLGPMRGADGGLIVEAGPSADAFFAMDPPPMYCGVDGGAPPKVGGTLACPSDKNRQGCPCPTAGATAACWPGLRVDRNLGQCKDGTTTCITSGEGLTNEWGACEGYVLPTPGATSGAAACKCFSSGQWNLTNLSPCFISYGATATPTNTYAVSSYVVDGGIACPSGSTTPPPAPQPGVPWSSDTLQVDCEGTFTLCYTIKAGSLSNPSPSDCVVGSACVSGDYTTANLAQAFPPLPGWTGMDQACAAQFQATGGYGEMTVKGLSELCEPIGADGGASPEVFNRVGYCPASCETGDGGPSCATCQSGGSGSFGN